MVVGIAPKGLDNAAHRVAVTATSLSTSASQDVVSKL